MKARVTAGAQPHVLASALQGATQRASVPVSHGVQVLAVIPGVTVNDWGSGLEVRFCNIGQAQITSTLRKGNGKPVNWSTVRMDNGFEFPGLGTYNITTPVELNGAMHLIFDRRQTVIEPVAVR
jgi:hypothetical protein